MDAWLRLHEVMSDGEDKDAKRLQEAGEEPEPFIPKNEVDAVNQLRRMKLAQAYQVAEQTADARKFWREHAAVAGHDGDMASVFGFLERGEILKMLEAFLVSHTPEDMKLALQIYESCVEQGHFKWDMSKEQSKWHELTVQRISELKRHYLVSSDENAAFKASQLDKSFEKIWETIQTNMPWRHPTQTPMVYDNSIDDEDAPPKPWFEPSELGACMALERNKDVIIEESQPTCPPAD